MADFASSLSDLSVSFSGKFTLGLSSSGIGGDSSFLVHQFISSILRKNGPFEKKETGVLLVSSEQSFFHYSTIQKKLGINLNNEVNSGRFHFINIVNNDPYNWNDEKEKQNSSSSVFSINKENSNWTKELFEKMKLTLQQSKIPINVIIDNLHFMENSCSNSQLFTFVHYCKLLCENMKTTFICILERFEENDSLKFNDETIINLLKNEADIVLSVNSLSTGYSKEIHGQLVFDVKTDNFSDFSQNQQNTKSKTYHYKSLDTGIKVFGVGSKDSL